MHEIKRYIYIKKVNFDISQRQYYITPPNIILPVISQKFSFKLNINMKMLIQVTLDTFPSPESEKQLIKVDSHKYTYCLLLLL